MGAAAAGAALLGAAHPRSNLVASPAQRLRSAAAATRAASAPAPPPRAASQRARTLHASRPFAAAALHASRPFAAAALSGGPGEPQPPPRAPVPPAAPPLGRAPSDAPADAHPRVLSRPFVRGETLQLTVKGVSFGARPAAVAALRPGDPVVFAREPENEADANAVAVLKPDGTPLGYVPRQLTAALRDDAAPGRVASTGVNAAGLAWAVVAVKPAGPGLAADLPPAAGAPFSLQTALPAAAWDRLAAGATDAAHGRCAGCGMGAAEPLQVLPAWRFDAKTRVATLRGLAPHCAACAAARALARGVEDDVAVAHLSVVNGWTTEQAQQHAAWAVAERARRAAAGPWRADVAWLRAQEGLTDADVAAAEAVMQ